MSRSYLGKLGVAPCVMPIGPVAYWWDTDEYKHWDLPEHWQYVKYREMLNDALVEHGFLVYRHWEAFKGTWNDDFQDVNNIMLDRAWAVIDITPLWIDSINEACWSEGRDKEVAKLRETGTLYKLITAPMPKYESEFPWKIKEILAELDKMLDS
jgi:hypothetical protein